MLICGPELLTDMLAYGFIIGAISLSSFVLVVWGFGGGDLGAGGCNNSREGCEIVFRARATCFATTSWLCLLLAWEMLDMRRSVFWMHDGAKNPWTRWTKDLWANQVLFWVSGLPHAALSSIIDDIVSFSPSSLDLWAPW